MKKIAYLFCLSLFSAILWTGCKEKEEAVTPPAADLKAYAGKYRAKLEFTAPAKAKSFKVFYGVGKFQEQSVAGDGVQNVIVEELPEGEQTLRVAVFDDAGVISDPKGVKVKVYGETYQNSLRARSLTEQDILSASSMAFSFGEAADDETGVWIVFVNTSGAADSVKISNSQTSITVNNINPDGACYYYSVYSPEAEAIDEFRSKPIDVREAAMFEFKKEEWTIADFSDHEPGSGESWGLASNIIDDDVTTFWHSQIVETQPSMPHWITVDMRSEKKFNGFYFVQTQEMSEVGLAKGFRLEISSDNNSWTNVLEGEFTTSRARQEFAFAQQVTARYFKITILSGYNDVWWSQFAEIDLYNELNVSGMNGDIKLNVLVNAEPPFQGKNPVANTENRFQQLVGWTHNEAARVSYDTHPAINKIALFSMPAGGIPYVTNGKVYQTVSLQPGNYKLAFDCGSLDGGKGVDAYGVATTAATLPDITAVTTDSDVLGYSALIQYTNNEISFTLSSASPVTVGWVYDTYDSGNIWTALMINGIELYKN
ncbi:MAG: DUF5013 domain-containing protein [Bacteroidales bacterium]|jgi:hypothetical protein|nr:DUF5013 domain-containing protein [Bacteroidales bacterium]